MSVLNITELFALDDDTLFITESYRNLLQRDPDDQGMAYYLGRLALGYSKESVINQLAQSRECRPHQEILGLEDLVKKESRAQHWFWGLAIRITRMKNRTRVLQIDLAKNKNSLAKSGCALKAEHIQEAYRLVLERDAESEAIINGPATHGTIENLYRSLLASEEFREKLIKSLNQFDGLTRPLSEMLDDYALQIYNDIKLEIKLHDLGVA